MCWFELNAKLLQDEEEALIQSGYKYTIDEAARQDGRLIIDVIFHINNGNEEHEHILKCVYPSSYPYFAVEVFGKTLPTGRHINPTDYRLCLYEDEQNSWNPSGDNLASALDTQVPIIIERHLNPDIASDLEEQVGYQVTGQIRYEDISVIFVGDELPSNLTSSGKLTLKISEFGNSKKSFPIVGILDSIECGSDTTQIDHGVLHELYTKKCNARWVKINTIPHPLSSEAILQESIKVSPEVKNPNYGKIGVDILGVLIPEESEYREKIYNWVFIVRRQQIKIKGHKFNPNTLASNLIRSDRYSSENRSKRVPRHKSLGNKRVTIVGLGALGSHIAWQLARAGVKNLSLIDCDIVQAGNLPRWLFGIPAIGHLKAHIVADYLIHNYPDIQCKRFNLRVGSGQKYNVDGVFVDAHKFTTQILEDSDIVIDAVAETNVSLYLSNICDEIEKPYIWATGTQGGWGGIIGRVIPNVTEGTWTDFSYQYANNIIKRPPAELGSDIQPVGCFSTTFTGSGFDLDHISLMATRCAVSTLSMGSNEGYPDFDWDIGVLKLWDEEKSLPIAPHWDTYELSKYKND